jgi:hypothetical protein
VIAKPQGARPIESVEVKAANVSNNDLNNSPVNDHILIVPDNLECLAEMRLLLVIIQ